MLGPKPTSKARAYLLCQDDTPPPAGEMMQARERIAMSVVADIEIGNSRDIASVVFQA